MNIDLDKTLEYFKFQNGLKTVFRNNWTEDGRKESSAEHSWSVAMMTWLLSDAVEKDLGIKLNQNTMLKMALIHDIVEIESGDVAAWDQKERLAVVSKEHLAIEKLSLTFFDTDNSEIATLWNEHDELKTYESKLVKACDQLCPLVYRVVFKCSYHGKGVDRAKLDSIFLKIVDFSNVTKELYQKLANEIDQMGLFDENIGDNHQ